jgi:hypothetical protein
MPDYSEAIEGLRLELAGIGKALGRIADALESAEPIRVDVERFDNLVDAVDGRLESIDRGIDRLGDVIEGA